MIRIFFLLICMIVCCGAGAMDERPAIQGELVAEAFQSEAVFTCATDAKPIVATYGCGPCVAVGGYDNVNKMAFMIHFATAYEVLQCGNKIFDNIRLLAPQKLTTQTPILLYLRGGHEGMSEVTIKAIKYWMQLAIDLPMTIGSEEILCYQPEGKSLLLDSRSGIVSDYDPILNLHRRIYFARDRRHAEMSYRCPNIRIAYTACRHDA